MMSKLSRHRRARDQARHRVFGILGLVAAVAALAVAAFLLRGGQPAGAGLAGETANVKGVASAPVEIEDWSDFQCPHCKTFATTIVPRLEQSLIPNGTVRLVFRHMAFLGEDSVQAAGAAECAADQGQFWAYHDRLFAEQRGRGSGAFSKPNLKRFGGQLSVDTASFERCVDEGFGVARARAETQAGERKGVKSTPTLFVNGQKIEGVPSWEALLRVIDETVALVPAPAPRRL
jgi:protein-disulfide isomerase